ncbi:MAG: VCBS repeat-containing protein [Chloroflexi bacterium]|nr:VCBS repeat-containing protein [Chloroflexota bacterium]
MNRKHFVLMLAVALTVIALAAFLWRPGQAGAIAQAPSTAETPAANVLATGRGQPWINLRDGLSIAATYSGPAAAMRALAAGRAEPLSLTSADFDGDGTADLAAGYRDVAAGLIVVQAGNPDFMYPDSPAAAAHRAAGTFVAAPFLPAAAIFAAPVSPDFLATGDFDADGRQDLALAARGSAALYFLPGDGRGGFGPSRVTSLPGAVTALAVGEINRRDGLADVAVGVVGANGRSPLLLIFEGPEGALRAKPELFDLPAPATGLALAGLDDDPYRDLAIAAGNNLLLVRGRDRWLSLPDGMQPQVAPAQVERQTLPFAIVSLAAGDFVWSQAYHLELALLADDGSLHLLNGAGKELNREDLDHEVTKEGEAHEARSREDVSSQHLSFTPFVLRDLRETSRLRDPNALPLPSLLTSRVSFAPLDTIIVLDPADQKIHIALIAPGAQSPMPNLQSLTSLDAASAPVAILPLRLNLDAMSDLVILRRGATQPDVVLTAPSASVMVNSAGDEDDPYQ